MLDIKSLIDEIITFGQQDNKVLEQERLLLLETELKNRIPHMNQEYYHRDSSWLPKGTAMLPSEIADPALIKHVYLSGNEGLIALFKRYVPIPKNYLFDDLHRPPAITETMQEAKIVIQNFIKRNQGNEQAVEKAIVTIQRNTRKLNRQKEENLRIHSIIARNYQSFHSFRRTKSPQSMAR